MREFEYKLAEFLTDDVTPNPYSGKVKVKVLKFLERNKLLREVNFKLSNKGEADINANLESVDKLSEIVKDNLLSLDVKKGKKKFTSLDELEYDNDVTNFFTEIGLVLVRGVDLGNG
jgi:hypothetical protein